ncbi:MAG: hypothetical protein GQ574_15000 [Crocinitomix sp.]|nr:hypothetical protein [Crocinitomix sp.]
MMRTFNFNISFSIVLIAFCWVQGSWAQDDAKLTLEDWNLNGSVKSIAEYSYGARIEGDSIYVDSSMHIMLPPDCHTLEFNMEGYMIDFLEYMYRPDGSSAKHYAYEYSDQNTLLSKVNVKTGVNAVPYDSLVLNKGGLLMEQWREYKDTIRLNKRITYLNDKSSKPILVESISNGIVSYSTSYEYDSLSRIENCIKRAYGSGRNYMTEIELYDSLERMIELKTYGNDVLEQIETFEYNDLSQKATHRLVKIPEYDAPEGPSYRDFFKTFHYDDNNNLIRIDYYDRDGKVSNQYEYVFDSNNRMLYERYYDLWEYTRELDEELSWEYSIDGLLKTHIHRYKFLSPTLHETKDMYTYDVHGNWLTKTVISSDGRNSYIIIRTYTYYN